MNQLEKVETVTMAQQESVIEVRNIAAAYTDKIVIEDLSFSVSQGEQMSLLGPSGCGKSTALRCIAGLETPLAGEIRIAGETVFSSSRGINVPPEKRGLAMVFQSYAIWPHLTVFGNVSYGLRSRGVRGEELERRTRKALELVGLAELAERSAAALSGGQQQRVALARAYASAPKAILLDEPLSNLDARLRVQMREELKEIQRESGLTTLYVTHDQEEAMAMSDRIIIMRAGDIEQIGAPLDIYNWPRTRFVADFIGAANIMVATIQSGPGPLVVKVGDAHVECAPNQRPTKAGPEGRHLLALRTVYADLSAERRGDKNSWPAKIVRRTILGDIVHYIASWPGGELRVHGLPRDIFEEGQDVWLHIPSQHAVLVDASE